MANEHVCIVNCTPLIYTIDCMACDNKTHVLLIRPHRYDNENVCITNHVRISTKVSFNIP